MASDVERALAAGMDGHVAKPFALEELHSALDLALAASHAPANAAAETKAVVIPAGLEASQSGFLFDPDGRPKRHIIESFLRELPQRVETLLAAARDRDLEGISEAAHALRGSSSFIGAPRLAGVTADIDARARDGEVPDAQTLSALQDASREVEAALTGLLD
jgi:HPt (histidine-containing phosphotransfer) domain-containing protein